MDTRIFKQQSFALVGSWIIVLLHIILYANTQGWFYLAYLTHWMFFYIVIANTWLFIATFKPDKTYITLQKICVSFPLAILVLYLCLEMPFNPFSATTLFFHIAPVLVQAPHWFTICQHTDQRYFRDQVWLGFIAAAYLLVNITVTLTTQKVIYPVLNWSQYPIIATIASFIGISMMLGLSYILWHIVMIRLLPLYQSSNTKSIGKYQ